MKSLNIPKVRMVGEAVIQKVIDEALDVLKKVGVVVENEKALTLLADHGAKVDKKTGKVWFPNQMVEEALRTVPHTIEIFDRNDNKVMTLSNRNVHFVPGSAALHILDRETQIPRKATSTDLFQFVRICDVLPTYPAQSTGLIASDVPEEISDRYRLFYSLQYSTKPIVTGTFSMDGFDAMLEMLIAVRGSKRALRQRPLAIFDCCPSPPLKWSNLTCHDLMACAEACVPAELVSMPLTGATAPATMVGALVQLTAENLSGVVIHQLVKPGAPIIFGGSPAAFDMRQGTTPMGAIETMMIDAAYAQIGRQLGLPTHSYMALSDAKQLDAQAGFETGMGAVLAALAGINVVSGPGMLDFESCQSLEKLVLDNEICAMALRLQRGIVAYSELFSEDLYGEIYEGDHFLTSPTTLAHYREEFYFVRDVVERKNLQDWISSGKKSLWERARREVDRLLKESSLEPLERGVQKELEKLMLTQAKNVGMDSLPEVEGQEK